MTTTAENKLPAEIDRGDDIDLLMTLVSPDEGNKSQFTAEADKGATAINVVDGSLFGVGDELEIREFPLKQSAEIASINVNELTLVDPLLQAYGIASQAVQVDVPQDITGSTLTFTMKQSLDLPDSEASIKLTATLLDQVTNRGQALIQIPMDVEAGDYWYDIEFISSGGRKTTLTRERVRILQDVTED